jgi:hypothetical protein
LDNPFYLDPKLENHINDKGKITEKTREGIEKSIEAALNIGRRLIGGTIVTRNKKYVLSMLELYYGSVGDDAHDWYKVNYSKNVANGISREQVKLQEQEGLCFYSKHRKNSNWNRIDIVVGQKGTAVSFLIRNLINIKDGKSLVPNPKGGSGLVARELFSESIVEKPKIDCYKKSNSCHHFYDTHEAFLKANDKSDKDIESKLRCVNNKHNGIDGRYKKRKWNLSIYPKHFIIPDEIKKI